MLKLPPKAFNTSYYPFLTHQDDSEALIEDSLQQGSVKMNSLESSANDHNLDRLSALPDSLIHEILSLLRMRDVVRTSLLSKRWNCLWMTTPCLQFDACGEEDGDPDQFRNFVSRALTLWRGTRLRKFSIDFMGLEEYVISSLSSDIDIWLLFAKRMKVEELLIKCSLSVDVEEWLYRPPQCLYKCSSLRKLKLVGCDLQIHGGVQWDKLNSLNLQSCWFHEDVLKQILASSTQLETVILDSLECESMSIRSSSLKRLLVSFDYNYNLENAMTIYAPNLEALQLKGPPFNKYLLTNVSSLTEVLLDFTGNCTGEEVSGVVVEEALCQILPAIQHVVTVLELSASCVKMLGVMKGKLAFSPLLNVKLLRISSGGLAETRELVGLLEVFPKLKTLIIDWGYHVKLFELNGENYTMCEANILKSNLLRTVEIIWTGHLHASIFQFIECLLKHSTMIEKIVIRKIDYMYRLLMFEATENVTILQSSYEDMFLAAQKVVSLQRSFPCVELVLLKSIR